MQEELFDAPEPDRHTLATPDGTPLDLATSSLIKYLRRGREVEALYFARQIEARYPLYFWRRASIFAAEDVGLADPTAITTIVSLRTAYDQIRNESRAHRPDGVLVAFAVLFLCRSAKNREADDLKNAVEHLVTDQGWTAPIPPAAIDWHTAQGRQQLSDHELLQLWLHEGSRIENEVGPLDWKLWVRRWAARDGALDPDQVEADAIEWDRHGLLRYGLDGYPPRVS